MKTYRTEVVINMWDDESGLPTPAVTSVINLFVTQCDDPREMLTAKALSEASKVVTGARPRL